MGFDEIPIRFLKACVGMLAQSIMIIINKSFAQATVPVQLKTAKVVPIQKSKLDESITPSYFNTTCPLQDPRTSCSCSAY